MSNDNVTMFKIDSKTNEKIDEILPTNNVEKELKYVSKKIRGFIILFIFLILSCYSYLNLRFNTLEIHPLNYFLFINIFAIFLIPLSTIKNIIREKWIKPGLNNEIEITNEQLEIYCNKENSSEYLFEGINNEYIEYRKKFWFFVFCLSILWTGANIFYIMEYLIHPV